MDDDTDNHPEVHEAHDHAVVLGAGLAGLLAARALAQRFARVTVVERDELPDTGPAFRPGVPQSRHVHVLWSRGLELMEGLLPGVTRELLAAGAALMETPRDFLWLSPADWFHPVPGSRILIGSRELIDWTVRREVLRDERIRVRSGSTATGLVAGPDGRSVTGVRLREGDPLPARLVVDATGRTSRAPAWLAALGHPAPATTRYDSRLGYSSRYYEIPPDPARRWQGIYVQGRPENPRGGVLVPLDDGRWLVTLTGNGEHAPRPGRRSSSTSPGPCAPRCCTTRSGTPNHSRRRRVTATPPTNGGTSSASTAGRPDSSSSATPSAGSTPCTGRG